MFKKIALGIVVVIAVILGIAGTKPSHFSVQRAIAIKAPPAKIFPYINDLHRWSAWSPYDKKDPEMKRTFSGPPSGEGAVYEWAGNSEVGEGRMRITSSTPPARIAIKLDFEKPIEGHNVAAFLLEPQDDMTQVTWTVSGPTPFVSKLMQVFFNFDRMIGDDFEQGLANLKALAEK